MLEIVKLHAQDWLECCRNIEKNNINRWKEASSYYYLRDQYFDNIIDPSKITKEIAALQKLSMEGIGASNVELSSSIDNFLGYCTKYYNNFSTFAIFTVALEEKGFNFAQSKHGGAYLRAERARLYKEAEERRERERRLRVEREQKELRERQQREQDARDRAARDRAARLLKEQNDRKAWTEREAARLERIRKEKAKAKAKERTQKLGIFIVIAAIVIGLIYFLGGSGKAAPSNNSSAPALTTASTHYEGELKDGKPHGYGTMTDKYAKTKYIGKWKDGKKHGIGELQWTDGNKIVGEWADGDIVKSTYYYANGDRFEGGLKNGKRHGEGTFTPHNGKKQEGRWENDKLVKSYSIASKKPEVAKPVAAAATKPAENKSSGFQTINYASGDKYEGHMRDGKKHGEGTITWADGEKFSGTWANDKRIKGTYAWKNGDTYTGTWVNNKKNEGTFIWKNGDTYTGTWVNDKMVKGTFIWKSGNKYEGQFNNLKMHGKGTMIWANGNIYEGGWKDNNMHGEGIMIYSNGSYTGTWVNDKKHGKGTYVWTDGSVYTGEWKNDKQVQ